MTSKVFIVTGASKGIGAAITRYLLNQSHKVVITARSSEPLEGLKKSHPEQVQFIAGDIVEPQVSNPIESLGVTRLIYAL
jgi:NADP-dependent 3-hydroxy acid dehydrogenase YdfG